MGSFDTLYAKIKSNKNSMIWFVFYMVIFFLVFNIFFNVSYTSDKIGDYISKSYSIKTDIRGSLENGRYTMIPIAVFNWLLRFLFKTRIEADFQHILQALSVILYAICAEYGARLIINKSSFKNNRFDFVVHVLMIIGFVNPFIVELYTYPGISWGIGILLVFVGVKYFGEKKWLKSFGFIFLAVSVYQNYYALFLIWVFLIQLLSDRSLKIGNSLKQYTKAIIIAGASGVINIVSVKVLVKLGILNSVIKEAGVFPEGKMHRILNLIRTVLGRLRDGYGLLPKYFLFLLSIVLLIFILLGCYNFYKNKITTAFVFLISGIILITTFSIGLIMKDLWLPTRVTFIYFFSITALFILGYYYCFDQKFKRTAIEFVAGTVLGILVIYCTRASLDVYITNALDKEYVIMVQNQIEDYEIESGYKIKKIAAKRGDNINWCYWNEVYSDYKYSSFNNKIAYDTWADVEWLNYWTKNNYEEIEMPDKIFSEYFADKSWDCFDPGEQLYFEGDTLYWVIY